MSLHNFGPHNEKSRIIWHAGTIQPYSSLWIILQRFLMLNGTTPSAFAQDFIYADLIKNFTRISLNSNVTGRELTQFRLLRLARALHESPNKFEYTFIGQYPRSTWPLFRNVAFCETCLTEGFHSVLFSLDGLTRCPIHNDKILPYACCKLNEYTHAIQRSDFQVPGKCICGKKIFEFPIARVPKVNTDRDEALAEVTNWLNLIGSRCFLGLNNSQIAGSQVDRFSRHVSTLTGPLQLGLPPSWWPTNFSSMTLFLKSMKLIEYGAITEKDRFYKFNKFAKPSLNYSYQQNKSKRISKEYLDILEKDFKSIKRHLLHHTVKNSRKWISKFAATSDANRISDLIQKGGVEAQNAWAVLIWWQSNVSVLSIRDLTRKTSLRSFSLFDIPSSFLPEIMDTFFSLPHSAEQLWTARWLCAISYLNQWLRSKVLASRIKGLDLLAWGRGVIGLDYEYDWSLGINTQDKLILCVNKAIGSLKSENLKLNKLQRQVNYSKFIHTRFENLQNQSLQSCNWYHGANTEWDSAPGPIPIKYSDCKRLHFKICNKKYYFLIFPWMQSSDEQRKFVARCLDFPIAGTGPSPKDAIYSLKYSLNRQLHFAQK
jgi:hypothetical protein